MESINLTAPSKKYEMCKCGFLTVNLDKHTKSVSCYKRCLAKGIEPFPYIIGTNEVEERDDDRERKLEKRREYYDKNKDRLRDYNRHRYDKDSLDFIICECKAVIKAYNYNYHLNGRRHQKFLGNPLFGRYTCEACDREIDEVRKEAHEQTAFHIKKISEKKYNDNKNGKCVDNICQRVGF